MIKAYSIFDDFPKSAILILNTAGVEVTVQACGTSRPNEDEIKAIIEEYDIVIVGTSQKMPEKVFENIDCSKIIGTASIGMDHISIPDCKKKYIHIVNAPIANRISVAEHTFALVLAFRKYICLGREIACEGKSKKAMGYTPMDLCGSSIGVVGAGGTASAVLKLANSFGMRCLCWTPHPELHTEISNVEFKPLNEMISSVEILSVNIPLTETTKNLIDRQRISLMKPNSTFISTSRAEVVDMVALFEKAGMERTFNVGLDVDADKVHDFWNHDMNNVIVTPHIAGGTVQSRVRMFEEVSRNIAVVLEDNLRV